MTSSSATTGQRGVPRGWLLAGLVALSYFCTSLVVVLNALDNATGVVWLPRLDGCVSVGVNFSNFSAGNPGALVDLNKNLGDSVQYGAGPPSFRPLLVPGNERQGFAG